MMIDNHEHPGAFSGDIAVVKRLDIEPNREPVTLAAEHLLTNLYLVIISCLLIS